MASGVEPDNGSTWTEDDATVLEEETVYKATASSEYVVVRKIRLYSGKFVTYHNFEKDADDKKLWLLDPRCSLQPKSAGEIVEPVAKLIRPRGQWAITSLVKSKGQPVTLYVFTLHWPTRWAAKGYTSFTFGFKDGVMARHWYNKIAEQLEMIRATKGTSSGGFTFRNTSFRNSKYRALVKDNTPSGRYAAEVSVHEDLSASRDTRAGEVEHAVDDTSSTATGNHMPAGGGSIHEHEGSDSDYAEADSDSDDGLPQGPRDAGAEAHVGIGGDAGCSGLHPGNLRAQNNANVLHVRNRQWMPYKQTNGVAIYHHHVQASDAGSGVGGEYMVSAVVRGSPNRCLEVLRCRDSNTSLLGPAVRRQVLSRGTALGEKEVQRIVLQAEGFAGVMCAQREVIIETVVKHEDGPAIVIMFNSCDAAIYDHKPGQAPQADVAAGPSGAAAQVEASGIERSWYAKPVLARVQGGYTIAPLLDYSLDLSPESLITCIIKVDLGGVCGERSWLRLPAKLAGLTDAFLDRILMAVILVRDEVEHGRFTVQPFSVLASPATDQRPGQSRRERQHSSAADHSVRSLSAVVDGAAAAAPAGQERTKSTKTAHCMMPQLSCILRREPSVTAIATPRIGGASGIGAEAEPAPAPVPCHLPAAALEAARSLGAPTEPGDYLGRMRGLSTLDTKVWENLHQPGKDAPFKIRGPTYLKDRKKIPAGFSKFVLSTLDVIEHPPGPPTEHVARFIPAIRQGGAPFSFIIHLVIPGTPLLGIVATFSAPCHPGLLGNPPKDPMGDEHDWEPFHFALHKFMNGSQHLRNNTLKLIPHIADGSWMIKQSVGTTPVILGRQLKTTYHETPQYIEMDVDVSANSVANYVTGLVRGATKSLVIDMGFVMEGTTPWELPEALVGTLRLNYLDCSKAYKIDTSKEIPLRPPACGGLPAGGAVPAHAATPSRRTPDQGPSPMGSAGASLTQVPLDTSAAASGAVTPVRSARTSLTNVPGSMASPIVGGSVASAPVSLVQDVASQPLQATFSDGAVPKRTTAHARTGSLASSVGGAAIGSPLKRASP